VYAQEQFCSYTILSRRSYLAEEQLWAKIHFYSWG
jgi:hypothetical protein